MREGATVVVRQGPEAIEADVVGPDQPRVDAEPALRLGRAPDGIKGLVA
jgi:hypothetical protein